MIGSVVWQRSHTRFHFFVSSIAKRAIMLRHVEESMNLFVISIKKR